MPSAKMPARRGPVPKALNAGRKEEVDRFSKSEVHSHRLYIETFEEFLSIFNESESSGSYVSGHSGVRETESLWMKLLV